MANPACTLEPPSHDLIPHCTGPILMVSASEAPLATQRMAEQLARKNNSMGSSCQPTIKLTDAASFSNTKFAPIPRSSEAFQELYTAAHQLANLENTRKRRQCKSSF